MLLTGSQVSMALSSSIVFVFTSLLFLSGYVLQQQTVRGLQDAIRPRLPTPVPKVEPAPPVVGVAFGRKDKLGGFGDWAVGGPDGGMGDELGWEEVGFDPEVTLERQEEEGFGDRSGERDDRTDRSRHDVVEQILSDGPAKDAMRLDEAPWEQAVMVRQSRTDASSRTDLEDDYEPAMEKMNANPVLALDDRQRMHRKGIRPSD